MISGRGIAQLITNGLRVQITYRPYAFIGQGWIVLPFSLYIVAFVFLITWLLTRKTAIGMFIESVGINFRSSFFSGSDEKKIKLLVYTFCGFCAGIAGLVLPFLQGLLLIFLGVSLISSESKWVRGKINALAKRFPRHAARIRSFKAGVASRCKRGLA